jgi:RNAse (barnase) inhibitor barstar
VRIRAFRQLRTTENEALELAKPIGIRSRKIKAHGASMLSDLSEFIFGAGAAHADGKDGFVAHVPTGISSRDQLFESLRQRLRLPDYFGDNWDALSDCLRDPSWLPQRRVVIMHQDVPQLPPNELATYLEVLAECIRDWKPDEQHELAAVFPKESRSALENVQA